MIGDLSNVDTTPEDQEELGQRRPRLIAGPALRPTIAPASTPEIGGGSASPAPTPTLGSTEDLENRAAHPIAPRLGDADELGSRRSRDEKALQDAEASGSGISRLPTAARIPLRVLETIGGAVEPGVMSLIPGTTLHHQAELGRLRSNIGGDVAEEEKEATAQHAEAQADLAREQARVAGNTKTGLTPEEVTIHDLMTGENGQPRVNPDTKQPYTYFEAYQKVMQAKQDVKPDVHPPVGEASAKQYNDSILRELNVNPKTKVDKIPPEYQVNASDTDAQAKEKLQRAKDLVGGATAQQHITVSTGNQGNARSDKSYQFNSTQLEKLRTPVEQRMDRMSTLLANINLKSPQADSLLAPEILSVSAGGQGSGLRMNEAELSRIVGGATKWTELKTALNKWSTDPNHATFTEEQRGQMMAIARIAADKYQKKLDILNDAEQALLETDDPKQHRQITAKAKKDLDAIDKAINQQAIGGKDLGPAPAGKPEGATGTLPDGTKVVVKGGRLISQ